MYPNKKKRMVKYLFKKGHKINLGRKRSQEIKEKISNSMKGRKPSKLCIEKLKERNLFNNPMSNHAIIEKMRQTKIKQFRNGTFVHPMLNKGKGWIDFDGYKRICHNGKSIKEHHFIWCSQKGNLPYIPNGFIIHHLDFNKLNNNPNNLLMLDTQTHNKLHWEVRK